MLRGVAVPIHLSQRWGTIFNPSSWGSDCLNGTNRGLVTLSTAFTPGGKPQALGLFRHVDPEFLLNCHYFSDFGRNASLQLRNHCHRAYPDARVDGASSSLSISSSIDSKSQALASEATAAGPGSLSGHWYCSESCCSQSSIGCSHTLDNMLWIGTGVCY